MSPRAFFSITARSFVFVLTGHSRHPVFPLTHTQLVRFIVTVETPKVACGDSWDFLTAKAIKHQFHRDTLLRFLREVLDQQVLFCWGQSAAVAIVAGHRLNLHGHHL